MSRVATHQIHNIDPVFDENCKVLILGSFPSCKSREIGFYFANPQNRFWDVMQEVFDCEIEKDTTSRINFCLSRHIGIWDVLRSCEIVGSSDATISSPEANCVDELIRKSNVSSIFTCGNKAYGLYKKYLEEKVGIKAICLPSTSAANARYSKEMLVSAYREIYEALQN